MRISLTIAYIFLFFNALQSQNFKTIFEKSHGLETATYQETIAYFKQLSKAYPELSINKMGETDSGLPLHVVIYNPDKDFNLAELHKNKTVILINNGIHPGESDGIDATMMLFRDLASKKIVSPKNLVLATIPIYNIGGSLNRNTTTRANQNGPKAYGFRGNSRNYDLNRDFIKNDTKNTTAFAQIFHLLKPDIFIDNHVSNGADYQYTLTHLFTQHNKLGGKLGIYLHTFLMPEVENRLKLNGWDITPYVNVFNQVPEKGFNQFMDYPRYSTGYTTLWNTLGMMVETHMLKPYKKRVEGTYNLMTVMIQIADEQHEKIKTLRHNAFDFFNNQKTYVLDWSIDSTKSSTLSFKGYEGNFVTSKVTGLKRLKYDRNKPFTKAVDYKNYVVPKTEVNIPKAYVIPQGWHDIIGLLKTNNIVLQPLEKDTIITVESYRILDFKTRTMVYEGHYQHYNTKITTNKIDILFKKGDIIVSTHQIGRRYLLETLEPQAPDSFFNWNFFDTILQQKEGFSPYVWEDKAEALLKNNLELKQQFNNKKETDIEFSNNWFAQLNWLYMHSDNYEKAHMQYPIYRIH